MNRPQGLSKSLSNLVEVYRRPITTQHQPHIYFPGDPNIPDEFDEGNFHYAVYPINPKSISTSKHPRYTVSLNSSSTIEIIEASDINELASIVSSMRTKNLRSVELPSSIRAIGSRAFYNTPIERIGIPDGVEIIESQAFAYCNNIEIVKLPRSLKELGPSAFEGCKRLRGLIISSRTPFKLIQENLKDLGHNINGIKVVD